MPLSRIFSKTAFAGALLLVSGLSLSPVLQSIGVALLFLHPFLNSQARTILPSLKKSPKHLLLILYYIVTFLSFFYTDDKAGFWKDVQTKLPFLLLPLCLVVVRFKPAEWKAIAIAFVSGVFVAALGTLADYFSHYKYYNALFLQAKSVPVITGVFHIYYGILLAFATVICLYASYRGLLKKRWEQSLNFFIVLVLLLCLHTVAARTGLVAFYLAVFIGILYYVIMSKKYLIGAVALVLLITAGLLSIRYVPALHKKMEMTRQDINRYMSGENRNYYSISMRLEAAEHTWNLYKTSPVVGVGPADLDTMVHMQYLIDGTWLLHENRKLPHHQFLETLANLGLAGEVILLLIFILPFLHRMTYKNYLYVAFLCIMIFSMQVESVLERQVGITFFCFFYLLLDKQSLISAFKKDISPQ